MCGEMSFLAECLSSFDCNRSMIIRCLLSCNGHSTFFLDTVHRIIFKSFYFFMLYWLKRDNFV